MEEVCVVAIEEHYNMRRIKEVLEIEKHPLNINMCDGLAISESWKPLFYILKERGNINNN